MKTGFKAGDLVKVKDDSWWLQRSQTFRAMIAPGSLVLVTDNIVGSKRFFYGLVCGSDGEAHLWSCDQFDLVQSAGQ
jgi:hypothetical protein|tara:strand:- start:582 stop:812 length:231 start_codon:yes stop_codon:yes gene_type:complete